MIMINWVLFMMVGFICYCKCNNYFWYLFSIELMGISSLFLCSFNWFVMLMICLLVCMSVLGCCLGISLVRSFGNVNCKL